jgi:glycosyltransferase involved in cell wall biosynthesis
MTQLPYLSLVVPTYNAASYIEENLRAILDALDGGLDEPFEVIIVCDGSCDDTEVSARRVADDRVSVLHYPVNQGKGHAILHGLAVARGRLVGWLDSDLDIAPEAIVVAAKRFGDGTVDAVVGSKRHPESSVRYPWIRRVYSWGYQLLVATLFRVNVRDTQVGAKVFRREALDTVGPLLLVKRWAFDLEVLAVAAEFGFDRIEDSPIELHYRFSGTSIDWRAVRRMLLDTLAIAYRIHLRHWYVRRFASLQRLRMDEAAAELLAGDNGEMSAQRSGAAAGDAAWGP